MIDEDVRLLLACYPKIYFACHMRHVRDAATRKELSAHQASILDHLDDKEPTTLNTLSKHMGVTASTMSLTVTRLIRGGYVVSERDAQDSRRVGLRLTAAGVRIKRMDKVLDENLVRALLEGMPESDRAKGLVGLELLAQAASRQIEGWVGRKPWEKKKPRSRSAV